MEGKASHVVQCYIVTRPISHATCAADQGGDQGLQDNRERRKRCRGIQPTPPQHAICSTLPPTAGVGVDNWSFGCVDNEMTPARCFHRIVVDCLRASSTPPLARTFSDASGDDVLAYWRHFLHRSNQGDAAPEGPVTAESVSRLLRDAVRVHRRQSPVLPDEVTELLVKFYSEALRPEQRHMFFSQLCSELSAQSEAIDSAARAWQELRSRPSASLDAVQRAAQELHAATQPLYLQARAAWLGRRSAGHARSCMHAAAAACAFVASPRPGLLASLGLVAELFAHLRRRRIALPVSRR